MIQTGNSSPAAPNLPIPGTFATTAQLCTRYQVSRTTWWRWSQMPGFPGAVRPLGSLVG